MNKVQIKKAMVFAAGRGARMGELTQHTPKPLLTVANKPLIDYTIQRLKDAGVDNLIINIAYLGEQIQSYLGNGESHGVTITYSVEPYPLETGGALLRALPLLGDEPLLVVNADVWTDYPFHALARQRLAAGDLARLVMVPNPAHNKTGDYRLTDKNRLELADQDVEGVSVTYSGIALLDPALITTYPDPCEKLHLPAVYDYFIQRNKISAELYVGEWLDIGTPERLASLNKNYV